MRMLLTYAAALIVLLLGLALMAVAALFAAATGFCLLAAAATLAGHWSAPGWSPIDWLLLMPFGLAGYVLFNRLSFALMTR